ncbi:hypothetical protein Scep_026523 [Stephania cephalantha]|uniref:Uncharacterized protein n=1 Tax=Stephania cephalantha TaxID=152367 RepID=A0AAP0HQH6_9MAGN
MKIRANTKLLFKLNWGFFGISMWWALEKSNLPPIKACRKWKIVVHRVYCQRPTCQQKLKSLKNATNLGS